MSCNCIEKIEGNVLNYLCKKDEYKQIESVEMEDIGFLMGKDISANTKTNFIVRMAGQKETHDVPVLHCYCPFCGEKYSK